ncbi:aminoglycoside phosphotransferase family protein [Ornithinimicrobium flavum]|uniref:aminoglycoside phosphotransferase family protein n=1 Tax=Ornithinimicrobium flavum TaxID=1288636 RepID=UPI001931009A|nr:aminoglycoside phosphotransferase family protein [Ornithinimicrobium flavum]
MSRALRQEDLPPALLQDLDGRPADRTTGPQTRAPRVDGTSWLDQLPRRVAEALERWDLSRDDTQPLRSGYTALVVPVRRPRGDRGALKVAWPHTESDTEHLALRAWKGRGAVELLAADPPSATLLLERLDPDRDLMTGPVVATTEVLGTLLRRLDRPAPPWAPPLSAVLARIGDRLDRLHHDPAAGRSFPRRLTQQARSLTRDLLAGSTGDTGDHPLDRRMVHTDLHQMNVLWRPDPGEWVAIDPKVLAGDPHWALAPALWNRWDDVLAAADARSHLRLRLGLLCDAAGLDEDRATAMTIVRLVAEAARSIEEGGADRETWVARAVTIVKAVQPG